MPIILGDTGGMPCCSVEERPQTESRPAAMQTESRPQSPKQTQPEAAIETGNRPAAPAGSQPMVVGMAYVPWQRWQQPYDYEKGLETGTIFPDLNLPFLGYRGGRDR